MTSSASPTPPTTQNCPSPVKEKPFRVWPAVAIVAVYWLIRLISEPIEKPYMIGFIIMIAASAALMLAHFGWWLACRKVRLYARLLAFFSIIGLGILAAPFYHVSVGWWGLMIGMPLVLTIWTFWLAAKGPRIFVSYTGVWSLLIIAAAWGSLNLIRVEGMDSALKSTIRWRWTPTPEELFLASQTDKGDGAADPALLNWSAVAQDGDWTEYRGAARDGVIRGTHIRTDWNENPPKALWRQPLGPAWSSVIVINDRLFTQEQRGEQEAAVCYDALTGRQLWVHQDRYRFEETTSGAGPRATPTFYEGRIYVLGAAGAFNCLDAATGKLIWTHNIAAESGAAVAQWGFSSSPLVTGGLAIVFAGGDTDKDLLAYSADSGRLAWTARAGASSYSSPQMATLGGKRQCLMLGDLGMTAFDPESGAPLWKFGVEWKGAPRAVQPRQLGDSRLVVATLEGFGVSALDVAQDGDSWTVSKVWESSNMRPEYSDFVVHEGHAYGYDVSTFCCIDLADGNRCWKAGHYGRGQVMLLADQSLLLVSSEKGEAVLLAANPKRLEEIGRFQAIKGKTWNHPVIVRGRLYMRNDQEMACYPLEAE
jgi:outer membrane protein assembly factor BamB